MATLAEQLAATRSRASDLLALDRELTDAELDEADQLARKASDLESQIGRHQRSQETLARLREAGTPPVDDQTAIVPAGAAPKAITQPVGRGRVSMAKALNESEQWRQFRAMYPNGVPDSQKGVSIPAVSVGSKQLLGDAASGIANLVTPDYLYPPAEIEPVRPPLVLRNLITNSTTQSDTIYYAREDSYTNAAAAVPEDGSVTKPESQLTYSRQSSTVETIAHWIGASKQALADVGQLATLVDNFLTWGVNAGLEAEMLNGPGGAGHFTGLLNVTGVQTAGPISGDVAGIEAIRHAITLVRLPGLAVPSAILMSVQDDENVDLARDQMGRFFGAGPFAMGPNTLWGLPRVVSTLLPTGTAIVGDFRRAVLWDREQASISVSDSHSDFFVRNLVAILGELRAAFGVFRPQAFVKVTLQ